MGNDTTLLVKEGVIIAPELLVPFHNQPNDEISDVFLNGKKYSIFRSVKKSDLFSTESIGEVEATLFRDFYTYEKIDPQEKIFKVYTVPSELSSEQWIALCVDETAGLYYYFRAEEVDPMPFEVYRSFF